MSAEPQETRDPGPGPLALTRGAISQRPAEILIVRMHHVVWKQSQIRQHHSPYSTPIQVGAAFLIGVSFIYFTWL